MTPEEAADNLINGNISTVKAWLKRCRKTNLVKFMQALRGEMGMKESEVYESVLKLLD